MSERRDRQPWLLRILVLAALALTLWFAGPRALAVLRARVADASTRESAPIDLGRGRFVRVPAWAAGRDPASDALRLAIASDLVERLDGGGRITALRMLDDAGAGELAARLQQSPWVLAVRTEREFPDRLRVELDLREPVLLVQRAAADGTPLDEALVDARGICIPPVRGYPARAGSAGPTLPLTVLVGDPPPPVERRAVLAGAVHPDRRVPAAAAIAAEWKREFVALCPEAPPLLEVDASNLDYRYLAGRRWAEVRVGLQAADGELVWFDYGRPPDSPLPRVPIADKVAVLRAILAEHPGLTALSRGSLILRNTWRSELGLR